jgi:hypothetical protein
MVRQTHTSCCCRGHDASHGMKWHCFALLCFALLCLFVCLFVYWLSVFFQILSEACFCWPSCLNQRVVRITKHFKCTVQYALLYLLHAMLASELSWESQQYFLCIKKNHEQMNIIIIIFDIYLQRNVCGKKQTKKQHA